MVPSTATDQELQHLRNALPDKVVVQRVEDRFSALGNCIVANDYVALAHTDLDRVKHYKFCISDLSFRKLKKLYQMYWVSRSSDKPWQEMLSWAHIVELQIKVD